MGKSPAFQFYVRDWLSDPQLKMASHQSKGIWIDLLCYMWESPERGTITGTIQELCRMLGTTDPEFIRFMDEAKRLNFASVTESNGKVTVLNRRMVREEKDRKNNALRQARHKSNVKSNADGNEKVTPPSSSSSSKDINTLVISGANNDCPHQEIIALYHDLLPMLPKVRQWTPKRQKNLRARWLSSKEYQDLDWWKEFFTFISTKCPHLTGKNDRNWTADLEWICTESNFVKILEGRYQK